MRRILRGVSITCISIRSNMGLSGWPRIGRFRHSGGRLPGGITRWIGATGNGLLVSLARDRRGEVVWLAKWWGAKSTPPYGLLLDRALGAGLCVVWEGDV
jgi:hypothetical protein